MSSFDLKNADSSATGSSATVGYQQSPDVSFANQMSEKTGYLDSWAHNQRCNCRGIQKSTLRVALLARES